MEMDCHGAAYWSAVLQAKRAFGEGETSFAEDAVRPLVLASWKRSVRYFGRGVAKKRKCIDQKALSRVMEKNRELMSCAVHVIDYLNTRLGSTESTVLLISMDGVLLYKNSGSECKVSSKLLPLGALMAEQYEGTTSPSLCLREKCMIELFGAEHLATEDEDQYCISVPIAGEGTDILGILTISLPLDMYHLHTAGMVMMAAKDISDQYKLNALVRIQEAIIEQADTGIVVLDLKGNITAVNESGKNMLHVSHKPMMKNFREIAGGAETLLESIHTGFVIRDKEYSFTLADAGVLDCVVSSCPIPEGKGMVLFIHEASREQRLAAHSVGGRAIYTFSSIIGTSPNLQKAVELGKIASRSDITTLILGESGTGKELFAHAIHNASVRKNAPFIIVNCGALPRDLVQSELFGYTPGSFTGAQRQGKPGKFELADGGTIFLDEIGDMPLDAQTNLLRVIQNREVSRIGAKYARPINVRIIAATNKNMQQCLRDGSFREDLYYRLSVLTINVPPLRERPQDIIPLAEHFLQACSRAIHKPCEGFSQDVISIFTRYGWQGNIRELENVVERALNITKGKFIELQDLSISLQGTDAEYDAVSRKVSRNDGAFPDGGVRHPEQGRYDYGTLHEREREILLETLRKNNGNMRKTAQELGIARSALYAKFHRLGIDIALLRGRKGPG